MSSIANLFGASQKVTTFNNINRPYCPSSLRTNANYASSAINAVSNFASTPCDQRANSTYAATRPMGLGLSHTELRAHLFDDCYSPPIYDVPLDEPLQQYSQSCHNSPLHKTTLGNSHPYDHLVPEALANEQLFSGYSQASPMIESSSDLDRSSCVFQEGNSCNIESKKPKPLQKQENVTINDMNFKDSLSSRNSNNSLLSSTRPYKKMMNGPPSSSTGQASGIRSQNCDSRWSAHRNSGGVRREPKSVIRGRASSLSDNDCFSSDEDELQCYSPVSKQSATEMAESNPDKIENDLNLSNLAAEIEEEFGSANSDQRVVSEDEKTLGSEGKLPDENAEDLWKQQNSERQSNRPVFYDRTKPVANQLSAVREPIGSRKTSAPNERDKSYQRSKPSAIKKRFPQRADSYAGHVSPILDDRFDKRTSVENVNRSALGNSNNSDQFYYQTTMV